MMEEPSPFFHTEAEVGALAFLSIYMLPSLKLFWPPLDPRRNRNVCLWGQKLVNLSVHVNLKLQTFKDFWGETINMEVILILQYSLYPLARAMTRSIWKCHITTNYWLLFAMLQCGFQFIFIIIKNQDFFFFFFLMLALLVCASKNVQRSWEPRSVT